MTQGEGVRAGAVLASSWGRGPVSTASRKSISEYHPGGGTGVPKTSLCLEVPPAVAAVGVPGPSVVAAALPDGFNAGQWPPGYQDRISDHAPLAALFQFPR